MTEDLRVPSPESAGARGSPEAQPDSLGFSLGRQTGSVGRSTEDDSRVRSEREASPAMSYDEDNGEDYDDVVTHEVDKGGESAFLESGGFELQQRPAAVAMGDFLGLETRLEGADDPLSKEERGRAASNARAAAGEAVAGVARAGFDANRRLQADSLMALANMVSAPNMVMPNCLRSTDFNPVVLTLTRFGLAALTGPRGPRSVRRAVRRPSADGPIARARPEPSRPRGGQRVLVGGPRRAARPDGRSQCGRHRRGDCRRTGRSGTA